MEKWWYAFTSRISLQADLYMIREDQICVANVVVIDLTQKTAATNVISRPIGAIQNLVPSLRFTNIEDFMKDTILL
jgi:hypothetical protein